MTMPQAGFKNKEDFRRVATASPWRPLAGGDFDPVEEVVVRRVPCSGFQTHRSHPFTARVQAPKAAKSWLDFCFMHKNKTSEA